MRASGHSGELRVGYQNAARLGPWTVVASGGRSAVRAQVVSEHQHWIEQRPIDIALHLAGVEWLWRDVSLTRTADGVEAVVTGRPIVEQQRETSGVR